MDNTLTRRSMLNAGLAGLAVAGSVSPLLPQQARPRVTTGPDRFTTDDAPFKTPSEPPNTPMGVGKGIHPGRVAWAHEPKVAKWDGETGDWRDDASTDQRLGVHEHWNNPADRQYSRNLGKREGIELVVWPPRRPQEQT